MNDSRRGKVAPPGKAPAPTPAHTCGDVTPIQLIALDLDGTLLGPDDSVSPANRRAVWAALDAGVRVAFVTGRGLDTAEHLARDLKLNVPIICAHGAITKDFLANRLIGHIPIPLDLAVDIVEFAEQRDLDVAVNVDDRFFRGAGRELIFADMHGPAWHHVKALSSVLTSAPTFIRFFGHEAVAAATERFKDAPLHLKRESWGDMEELAITSNRATKERALQELCRTLGVPAERVLAIGDSRNDVPMLRWAGIGVAMGNALPEVRNAVTLVTGRNDEDGVATAIERYVLQPLDGKKTA